MGYWNMTIQGLGSHHNPNYDGDADKMLREFVKTLRHRGHRIDHVSFHAQATENVDLTPSIFFDDPDKG